MQVASSSAKEIAGTHVKGGSSKCMKEGVQRGEYQLMNTSAVIVYEKLAPSLF